MKGAVVELAGRLALGRESPRIETLLAELLRKGELRVIFDMTRLDAIDSAGMAQVARAAGRLKASGGRLVVAATARAKVCPTVMEAADVFGRRRRSKRRRPARWKWLRGGNVP